MNTTTTTETIPLTRHIFTGIETEGIEFGIVLPDHDFTSRPGRFSYTIRLHKNGSVCDVACDCGLTKAVVVDGGATVAVGGWTWYGGRLALAGWRRIGPSEAEAELRERAEALAEELDDERGNHRVTEADLRNNIRNIQRLQVRRGQLRASIREARADRVRADKAAQRSAVAALAGWTVAVVLAVALVLAVIAS